MLSEQIQVAYGFAIQPTFEKFVSFFLNFNVESPTHFATPTLADHIWWIQYCGN